ncbi:hypothetical protein AWB61_12915 [Chromobacterium sp. F49]|nr:hypothetical protein Cv017_22215 [Chromobacterium subtsugae]KZE87237.1 hypothetical protein AWB61_12915 [Chromobacterium sp. F49]
MMNLRELMEEPLQDLAAPIRDSTILVANMGGLRLSLMTTRMCLLVGHLIRASQKASCRDLKLQHWIQFSGCIIATSIACGKCGCVPIQTITTRQSLNG